MPNSYKNLVNCHYSFSRSSRYKKYIVKSFISITSVLSTKKQLFFACTTESFSDFFEEVGKGSVTKMKNDFKPSYFSLGKKRVTRKQRNKDNTFYFKIFRSRNLPKGAYFLTYSTHTYIQDTDVKFLRK